MRLVPHLIHVLNTGLQLRPSSGFGTAVSTARGGCTSTVAKYSTLISAEYPHSLTRTMHRLRCKDGVAPCDATSVLTINSTSTRRSSTWCTSLRIQPHGVCVEKVGDPSSDTPPSYTRETLDTTRVHFSSRFGTSAAEAAFNEHRPDPEGFTGK